MGIRQERRQPRDQESGRPKLMTVAEIADYLGVTRKHVYQVVQHEMPVIQIERNLRFDPMAVYVYAERLKRRPA